MCQTEKKIRSKYCSFVHQIGPDAIVTLVCQSSYGHSMEVILRSVVHTATVDHEWVSGPDRAKDCVDVCKLCYK